MDWIWISDQFETLDWIWILNPFYSVDWILDFLDWISDFFQPLISFNQDTLIHIQVGRTEPKSLV